MKKTTKISVILLITLSFFSNCKESPLKDGTYRNKNLLYLLNIPSSSTVTLNIVYSGSCNYSPNQNYCTNLYYGVIPGVSAGTTSDAACTRIPGFGKSQTEPCPVQNFVGACYVYGSIAVRKLEVYYSPEFTKASAEEYCKNGSNFTSQAPFEARRPHHVTQFLDTYDVNFLPPLNLN